METQHTNHTLQEKALKLKKQRRRQILASLLGIALVGEYKCRQENCSQKCQFSLHVT